jgi:hypothetical protein
VIEYAIRVIIRITVGLLLLCSALAASGQYVTLTGQMQGANGLPASNNVISFEPSQMFFIPGTNTTQQVGNLYGSGAPTGTCAVSGQFYTNNSTTPPSLYQCIYGVWVYVGTQGSGTVTSVGISVPSWLTVTGSPITSNGTIAITGTSEAANLFLASPDGYSGAMTPRAIVSDDLPPTITSNTTGNASTATAFASTPTLCATGYAPTGILPNGNTTGCTAYDIAGAADTAQANASVYAASAQNNAETYAAALAPVAAGGTSGYVWTSQGLSASPIWAAPAAGTVTSIGITVPSILAVDPSTITTSGTFALTLASEPAYSVLNNATSSSNTPGFTDSPIVNNLTVVGTLSGGNIATGSARRGTFTCTAGGTISVSNTNGLITSDVTISLNTPGGTISTAPAMKTTTAGTGFTVLCGAADSSVYNYAIWN